MRPLRTKANTGNRGNLAAGAPSTCALFDDNKIYKKLPYGYLMHLLNVPNSNRRTSCSYIILHVAASR